MMADLRPKYVDLVTNWFFSVSLCWYIELVLDSNIYVKKIVMYKRLSVEVLSMETVVMQGSCQDFPLKIQGLVH